MHCKEGDFILRSFASVQQKWEYISAKKKVNDLHKKVAKNLTIKKTVDLKNVLP